MTDERKTQVREQNNNNRRVAPADYQDEDAGTCGKDTTTTTTTGVLDSSDSGSSNNSRFIPASLSSRRRERQARRRVQPLGEDESEEARVRGVPIPAVGRLLEELAADEPHHDHADAEVRKRMCVLHLPRCTCLDT